MKLVKTRPVECLVVFADIVINISTGMSIVNATVQIVFYRDGPIGIGLNFDYTVYGWN